MNRRSDRRKEEECIANHRGMTPGWCVPKLMNESSRRGTKCRQLVGARSSHRSRGRREAAIHLEAAGLSE